MELKEFVNKLNALSKTVYSIGSAGGSGISTLEDSIGYLKETLEKNDFTYTRFGALFPSDKHHYGEVDWVALKKEFDDLQQSLPELKAALGVDYFAELREIFECDDFVAQWNSLDNSDKDRLVYLNKDVYPMLRQKIDVAQFNFAIDEYDTTGFDGSYPMPIWDWIQNSSISEFDKMRKTHTGDYWEDFFESDKTKQAEKLGVDGRHDFAIQYLSKTPADKTQCWYDRRDSLTDKNFAFHYTFHFFSELEDKFNGYDKIRKEMVLPDILKVWAGEMLEADEKKHQAELKLLKEEKESLPVAQRHSKYPMIAYAHLLQDGLSRESFNNLKQLSKGTPYEEFFSDPMTQKMSYSMPYKRTDYMFLCFRDTFTAKTKKMKP